MGMACGGFMWAADLQSLHKHKCRNGALFWEGGGSGMAPQESMGLFSTPETTVSLQTSLLQAYPLALVNC